MTGSAEGHEITGLLQAWSAGNEQALPELINRVYDQLHRLAKRYMAGQPPNHPLQATALIHEAYIHLVGWQDVQWENRARFFAAASQVMRHILVDIARSQRQGKRAGGVMETTFDEACVLRPEKPRDLVLIDDGADQTGRDRSTEEPDCRVEILRRLDCRGNGYGSEGLRTHGSARVESGKGLAVPGDQRE